MNRIFFEIVNQGIINIRNKTDITDSEKREHV